MVLVAGLVYQRRDGYAGGYNAMERKLIGKIGPALWYRSNYSVELHLWKIKKQPTESM